MAISIDWEAKIISVPKSDLTLVQSDPFEIRQLDLDWFRLQLKDLEDSEEGIPFLDTHRHNAAVTVGGVTLAQVVEIINGYTVTFENGNYAVNLIGANSNVGDVTNLNEVSVRTANSAGLANVPITDFFTGMDIENGINMLQCQRLILATLAGLVSGAAGGTILIKNAKSGGGTKTRITASVDEFGNRTAITFDLTDE